ncbi:MAG TPA: spore germination protein GerW family protein [Chloroflexota bacterium]
MEVERLVAAIEALPQSASVRAVFGEPIRVGERVVVPVARVGGGFGVGFGEGERPPEGERAAPRGRGGGGGGRVTARPVAVIEITPEAVHVRPIVDATRLALAGMLLVAWNVFWVTLTIRALRARKGR